MADDIAREIEKLADDLVADRKRSIGEVAEELKVETHVIRFWEEKFPQIKPEIGAGKRRYYYNKQLKILKRIKKFLYEEGYTIAGLQKLLKKRKHDNYKEEDLDLILQESDSLPAQKQSENFDLDDFIVTSTIEKESNTQFSESAEELKQRLKSLKRNLTELKSLFL